MNQSTPAPKQTNDETAQQIAEDAMDARAMRIARETLTGDVRDVILQDMKDLKNALPWNLRSEMDQTMVIDQVNRLSSSIVERVVEIVAAGGRRTIKAKLNKLTIKDGIKAEIELSKYDEQRHTLFDNQGAMVMIVIADPEIYEGERDPVAITKQQTEMFDEPDKKDAA